MSRRVLIALSAAGGVVAVCAAAHAFVGSAGGQRPARPAVPATVELAAVPGDAVGPTTVVAGVPMGYRHDRAGAVSAALHFVVASQAVIAMDDRSASAAQREMATAAAGDGMAAELRTKLAALHDGFGPGPVGYRVAPLAVRAVAADGDHVDVDVWYVAVIEPPARSAYEDWRVMRYQMVWERGDWHEAAERDDAGPRPAALEAGQPTPPADWSAALAGFEPVGASDG